MTIWLKLVVGCGQKGRNVIRELENLRMREWEITERSLLQQSIVRQHDK
ncbi:MAG: hypothetical protein IPP06_00305 [Saprospiraceae bacterium]|nr:hypothetical protein [Candidatus Vicinibacter affinis]